MLRKVPIPLLGCVCVFLFAWNVHALAQSIPTEGHGFHVISPALCFTLVIPGEWEPTGDEGTYRSRDGKQFVGVIRFTAKSLQREKGNTLVEKEAAAVQEAYERDTRKKLFDVTLTPFESARQGTWKWGATLPNVKDRDKLHSPKRYFIDLSPDGLIVLNIQGTPDDDAFARRIILTFKHSEEQPCRLLRSAGDLLASAGVVSPGDAARAAATPLVTYNSAPYGWSVSYPKGWKVDDSKPEFVLVQAPDKSGHCGIHTAGVESKFKTAAEFADTMLAAREKHFGNVQSLLRQPAKLPSGLIGIESLADIQSTGRSHQLFVVESALGYIVDCETEIPNWKKLGPVFERVIRSFDVPNLTTLTGADTAPARTFRNPKHAWSISYPGGWTLDANDPGAVNISRPSSFAYAGCGIHSRPAEQSTALDGFADRSLSRNAESLQGQGIQIRVISRTNISLPNGVTGIEVMREMKQTKEVSGEGKSRTLFVLGDGMGYILDCQTDGRTWELLAPLFEQIISSFTLEKKP